MKIFIFLMIFVYKALKQEVAYASYLSIHTLVLPPPRNRKHIADYARAINAALDCSMYLQVSEVTSVIIVLRYSIFVS